MKELAPSKNYTNYRNSSKKIENLEVLSFSLARFFEHLAFKGSFKPWLFGFSTFIVKWVYIQIYNLPLCLPYFGYLPLFLITIQ
jgi:hypothetical protein